MNRDYQAKLKALSGSENCWHFAAFIQILCDHVITACTATHAQAFPQASLCSLHWAQRFPGDCAVKWATGNESICLEARGRRLQEATGSFGFSNTLEEKTPSLPQNPWTMAAPLFQVILCSSLPRCLPWWTRLTKHLLLHGNVWKLYFETMECQVLYCSAEPSGHEMHSSFWPLLLCATGFYPKTANMFSCIITRYYFPRGMSLK